MGGDRAPGEVIHGAVAAAKNGTPITLVGDAAQLEPLVDSAAPDGVGLEVVHASQVIEMREDPTSALREKKDASVSVAARLVANGDAGGFVSAGSTGAALAAAAFIIGRLDGASRPALATLMPNNKVVLDAGANLSCRALHLAEFAVMGTALARIHFSVETPRVGLLNIGAEEGKGRDLEKEAHALLASMGIINFIGNIEGGDIATESADVIVTDGYTGNVLLKTAEGAARVVQGIILSAIAQPQYGEAVASLAPALSEIRHQLDPESTGGAYLLGVRGMVVIAHGSSSRVAIENAIGLAVEGADYDLPGQIAEGLSQERAIVS